MTAVQCACLQPVRAIREVAHVQLRCGREKARRLLADRRGVVHVAPCSVVHVARWSVVHVAPCSVVQVARCQRRTRGTLKQRRAAVGAARNGQQGGPIATLHLSAAFAFRHTWAPSVSATSSRCDRNSRRAERGAHACANRGAETAPPFSAEAAGPPKARTPCCTQRRS
jgi:hypothetical protein